MKNRIAFLKFSIVCIILLFLPGCINSNSTMEYSNNNFEKVIIFSMNPNILTPLPITNNELFKRDDVYKVESVDKDVFDVIEKMLLNKKKSNKKIVDIRICCKVYENNNEIMEIFFNKFGYFKINNTIYNKNIELLKAIISLLPDDHRKGYQNILH